MALEKIALKNSIRGILEDLYDNSNSEDPQTPAEAREEFATRLSNVIDIFVKTGTVNTQVQTTGTQSSQTGTGIGSIT